MKKELFTIDYTRIPRAEFDDELRMLEQSAEQAALKAYAPYSRFNVGAALLMDNGEIVVGSNQENAAYPSGICAERTAIYYAGAHFPDVGIKKLVLVAITGGRRVEEISPCGACRQVIMESSMRHHAYPVYMVGVDSAIVLADCRFLLPFGFDGKDLPQTS